MDNIKFVIEEAKHLEGAKFKIYDVDVYLNDIKMPHNIFNASAVLPIANYRHVEFDLFTCGCGEAGCAGFQNNIVQHVKNGVVTWVFPERNDYITDKKVYNFDEKKYKDTLSNLMLKMLLLEKKKIIHNTMIRDQSSYGYEVSDEDRYEVRDTLKKSVSWYDGHYHGKQNFQDMLENIFPDYVTKKLKYSYNGVESIYEHSFGDIICRLLNEYPRKAKEVAYLKRCQLAGFSIIKFLNGEKEEFINIAYNSYEKNDMNSDSVIYWDFPKVRSPIFNFADLELKIVKE